MRTKLTVTLALLLILAALAACGGVQKETLEDGAVVTRREGGDMYSFSRLPRDISYAGETIQLTEFHALSMQGSNYNHSGYFVTVIDASSLTDEQFHWLLEADLDIDVYIKGGENELEFSSVTHLRTYYTDKTLYACFITPLSKSFRHSFLGADITLSVDVKENGKRDEYAYRITLDEDNCAILAEDLPAEIHDNLLNALQDYSGAMR